MRLGLAARMSTAGASTIGIRYRVFAEAQGPSGPYLPSAFTVQTATLSPAKVATDVLRPAQTDFKLLSTPFQGMTWATDWSTFTVKVDPAAETGIGIIGGDGPSYGPCGLVPAPTKVIILIDSITAI